MGQFADLYRKQQQQQQGVSQPPLAPTGFNAAYQDEEGSIYDEDLVFDRNFQRDSKIAYEMNNSTEAEKLTPEQYAKWGIEHMGWFNWNLPKMTLDASRISNATDEQKRAFLYMMDSYDDLGMSWKGAGRFFKGILADPSTYIGLSTFGLGAVGGAAGKQATKQGVKELLKQSTRGGVIAGVEAGVYTAADDINRQVVETSVSGEGIDFGRVAKAGAIGVGAGFAFGTGITVLAKKLKGKTTKEIAEEVDEQKQIDELVDLDAVVVADPESTVGRVQGALAKVVKAVKKTAPVGKSVAVGEDNVQNMEELVASVEPIKQLLKDASIESPDDLVKFLERQNLTDEQAQVLEVSTTQTVTLLKTRVANLLKKQKELEGDEAKAIADQIDEVEKVIIPLDELDMAMSTKTGRRLRQRQEGLNTGEVRGETIATLEKSGLSRSEAERKWEAIFSEKLIKKEREAELRGFNEKIEAARKSGDMSEYIKLRGEKKAKVAEFKEEVLRAEQNPIYRAINKPINVINKIVIGFVFSPATLIVNLVPSVAKTLYKPALNNLMADGLTKKTYRQTMAEYSAMKANIGSAFNMAKAAWRYQRSGLTGDTARFLEDQAPLPDKFGGQVFGFFPRALLATDAFFENINYRGFAVGDATGRAYEEAAELVGKGKLKEDEVDGFIEKKVKEAVDNAYTADENAIDILEATAITKGLTGKKRENFILNELENNQELFIKATNDDGKDYVQDLLFKRDFSGQGAASQLARGYEQFVNKHPAMRLMGQLFFRTPVRVFEEGIRMTPMLNLVSPKFMRELRGGDEVPKMRHIRAQGEAMMGYAIAGSVMSLYATGNITGSMGTNYKQTRQGENTGELEPYTIKFSDGSTFNYRNFDPFSTPVKIIVNALERAEMLAYREEQGENIDKTEMDKVQAWIAVATGSIATSIRDANLASGVDAVADLWEDLQEEDSDQLVKFVGRKAQMFLPNTYYKIQMLDDGFFGDPVTMEQFLRQRINPQDPKVPKRHSALGRIIENPNGWAGLLYFNTTTLEERKGDVPERVYDVEKHLYKLAQVGDTHFTAPYKFDKYFGGRDLRAIYTADGEETLYSRWMRYYYESGVVDVLHSQIGLPMGTASSVGIAEKAARKTINSFRKQACMRLYAEEAGIQDRHMELLERTVRAKSGELASDNIPFNIGN